MINTVNGSKFVKNIDLNDSVLSTFNSQYFVSEDLSFWQHLHVFISIATISYT
jgi:hypothetical protein